MAVLLIARFSGDVAELTRAYDRAHAMIMAAGGAEQFGELRHHCATSQDALYIVGVWQSEEHVRTRWQSPEFEERLVSVGFPSPKTADVTILDLRTIEPPLRPFGPLKREPASSRKLGICRYRQTAAA